MNVARLGALFLPRGRDAGWTTTQYCFLQPFPPSQILGKSMCSMVASFLAPLLDSVLHGHLKQFISNSPQERVGARLAFIG